MVGEGGGGRQGTGTTESRGWEGLGSRARRERNREWGWNCTAMLDISQKEGGQEEKGESCGFQGM